MMKTRLTDGSLYDTVRTFGDDRAVIVYRGAYRWAARVDADTFKLSENDAYPGEELTFFTALLAKGLP